MILGTERCGSRQINVLTCSLQPCPYEKAMQLCNDIPGLDILDCSFTKYESLKFVRDLAIYLTLNQLYLNC